MIIVINHFQLFKRKHIFKNIFNSKLSPKIHLTQFNPELAHLGQVLSRLSGSDLLYKIFGDFSYALIMVSGHGHD